MTESNIIPFKAGEIAIADHFAEYAGEGKNDLAGVSLNLPRIHIVQAMSPERKSKKAQDGQIAIRNTPGRDREDPLVVDALTFCIAQFKTCWVKWKRLPDGKRDPSAKFPEWSHEDGHVPAEFATDCEWRDDPKNPGKRVPPLANETYCFLATSPDYGCSFPIVMGFDGPASKPAKQLVQKLRGIKFKRADGTTFDAPLWAPVVRMTTVETTGGPSGNDSWCDPKFEIVGSVGPEHASIIRAEYLNIPRDAW